MCAEALSVDWINDKVYWTDRLRRTLEVYDIATQKSKVIVQFIDGDVPQGLGVFPYTGKGCVYYYFILYMHAYCYYVLLCVFYSQLHSFMHQLFVSCYITIFCFVSLGGYL